MKTIVTFIKSKKSNLRNSTITRTLGKVGLIHNRADLTNCGIPLPGETWIVEILRENISTAGGTFVLQPVKRVDQELITLQHNTYSIAQYASTLVLFPNEQGMFALSPQASKNLRETFQAEALVISMDPPDPEGNFWSRRPPPETALEREFRRIERE